MLDPNNIVGRIVLAIVTGVIVGAVVYIIGLLLVGAGVAFGSTVEAISTLLGLIAAALFFFFGKRTV